MTKPNTPVPVFQPLTQYREFPPPEMLQLEPAPVEAVSEGSSSKKLNETTDKLFDDETPPIARHTANVLPPAFSFSVIGILAAGLIGTIAIIHAQTDPTPTAVMTAQQKTQFVTKKNALAYAHRLLDDGRYDESVQAYDDFLKIYPKSIAGQQGRAEATKVADAHKSKTTITTQAPKATKKPAQKPSLWQRMFHRPKPK